MRPTRLRVPRAGAAVLVAAAVLPACSENLVRITPTVATVSITSPPATIDVGERVRLSAVVRSSSGSTVEGARVYWGGEDTTILQVDSVTGEAHARAPGRTRVAASSEDKHDAVEIVVPDGRLVKLDSLVQDELSVADDADEFTFRAQAGQMVNVLLRGTSGVASHRFRLRLMGAGGDVIDTVSSAGTDSTLEQQAIRWKVLPPGGTYRIRVEGSLGTDRGSYAFRVQGINPAPESIPALIRLPTAVSGESLTPGDVDTYTFTTATTNEEVSILFKVNSHSSRDAQRLTLLNPAGDEIVYVQAVGDYRDYQASGRQLLPVAGTYTIRVRGVDAAAKGPYDFKLLSITRIPEVANPTVAANTIVSETLAPQGDLDDFTYTAGADQELNVYLRAADGGAATDSIRLRVLNGATNLDSVGILGTDTVLLAHAIGHLKIGAGIYHIQVEGGRNTLLGYRFKVSPINLNPEGGVAGVVSTGATVTEAIQPVGDVDVYRYVGTASDSIRVDFRATSGSAGDVLRLTLSNAAGAEQLHVTANGAQGVQSVAMRVPQTANYYIRVEGVNSTDDGGLYTFQVVKVK